MIVNFFTALLVHCYTFWLVDSTSLEPRALNLKEVSKINYILVNKNILWVINRNVTDFKTNT